jgi:Tfp pilus assembly pilus retraction ATPase PilT
MNWTELAMTSHYQTAVAIKNEIKQGHIQNSTTGIEELIDALSRSDKRALRSQLTRLMMHIIKWQIQPERRSRSWLATIENARIEIEEILEEEPHLKPQLPQLWDKCQNAANRLAKQETGIKHSSIKLTKEEVFKTEYSLD